MYYKDDWEESKKRISAWWHGEMLDRMCIGVSAPLDTPRKKMEPRPVKEDPREHWMDIEYRLDNAEYAMNSTFYGGEKFPYINTFIGPGSLSLYVGGDAQFTHKTLWFEPINNIKETYSSLRVEDKHLYWKWQKEFCRAAKERAKDKYLVAMPDIIENVDIISSLRTANETLMDLAMDPDFIHGIQKKLNEWYFQVYDELYDITKENDGSSCFHCFDTWGPGRTAKVQIDLCPTISPEMMDELILPYFEEQCSKIDYAMFHLDGPGALVHLDRLLEIKGLKAIHWIPGAGKEPQWSSTWFDIYKKVIRANKSMIIGSGVPAAEVPRIVDAIGTKRFYIIAKADSEAEAKALLKQAEKWK